MLNSASEINLVSLKILMKLKQEGHDGSPEYHNTYRT